MFCSSQLLIPCFVAFIGSTGLTHECHYNWETRRTILLKYTVSSPDGEGRKINNLRPRLSKTKLASDSSTNLWGFHRS